jgi:DNA-binding CsgD family transcriptional regulator
MQKDILTQVTTNLTEREREILRLIATGTSTKDIAQQLFISSNTVKVHLRNIFAKIGVTSRTEAAVYAIHSGLSNASASPAAEPVAQELAATPPTSIKNKRKPYSLWLGALVIVLFVGVVSFVVIKYRTPVSTVISPVLPSPTLPSRWQVHAVMPTARSGLAVAVYENRIYAIGGETAQGVTGVVEQYDVATDTWNKLAPKPVPVTDVNAAVISGQIYIPGGRLNSGGVTDVLESFDPNRNLWEKHEPLPIALSGSALVAFEGRLYVIGGWDGQKYLNTVYIYLPESANWSTGNPMPTARAYAGAAVVEDKILVVGGKNQEGMVSVNEIFSPNLDSSNGSNWQTSEPLPVSVEGIDVISVADLIFAVVSEPDGNGIYLFHDNLGTEPKSWEMTPVPYEFGSRFSIAIMGTRLYIIGGQIKNRQLSWNVSYDIIYTIIFPIEK